MLRYTITVMGAKSGRKRLGHVDTVVEVAGMIGFLASEEFAAGSPSVWVAVDDGEPGDLRPCPRQIYSATFTSPEQLGLAVDGHLHDKG